MHAPWLWLGLWLSVGVGVSAVKPTPRLALLLDSSASMASQNRIEKMHTAVGGWIENLAPPDIILTLWKFANDAKEIKTALIDDTINSRQEIMDVIPGEASGSSCIACAIETILRHTKEKTFIVLITDGNDKFLEDDLEGLMKTLEKSQCRVISILIGNSLANMAILNKFSKGSVSHVADRNAVLHLLDALQEAALTVKNYLAPINIFEEEFSSSESHFHSVFSIDESLIQHDVYVQLYYWPHEMELNVNFSTPSGANQQMLATKSKFGYKKYNLQQMFQIGKWEIHIFSPTFNKFIALQVIANENEEYIRNKIEFNCWVEKGPNILSLCGSLHHQEYHIANTNLSVDIIAEDGEIRKDKLIKVFSGNDTLQTQEHLFVRKYINVTEPGYYSARCWIEGELIKAYSTVVESQHFSRVAWAGTFEMNKIYTQSKLPTEIKDLRILQDLNMIKCVMLLEFTAPSNALKYKVIISSSVYDILSGDGPILSTVPSTAGIMEKINFAIPSQYQLSPDPLYIAVSTIGEREGEISNIVQVKCLKNETKQPLLEGNQSSSDSIASQFSMSQPTTSSDFTTQDKWTTSFTSQIPYSSTVVERQDYKISSIATKEGYNVSTSLVTQEYKSTSTMPSTLSAMQDSTESEFQNYNQSVTTVMILNSTKLIYKEVSNEQNSVSKWAIALMVLVGLIVFAALGKLLHYFIYTRRKYRVYNVSYSQASTSNEANDK